VSALGQFGLLRQVRHYGRSSRVGGLRPVGAFLNVDGISSRKTACNIAINNEKKPLITAVRQSNNPLTIGSGRVPAKTHNVATTNSGNIRGMITFNINQLTNCSILPSSAFDQ
jgi:hypothetical protein